MIESDGPSHLERLQQDVVFRSVRLDSYNDTAT